jgi:hypothetical protein
MIEVKCMRRSSTALELQKLLANSELEGVLNWTGMPLILEGKPVQVVNANSRTDKLWAAQTLAEAGVPTVEIHVGNRPPEGEWLGRTKLHRKGYDLVTSRGKDRMWKTTDPDFWAKKEKLVDEYRCHVFKTDNGGYKVIRSAVRLPISPDCHPWVRSHRLGWRFSYTGLGGQSGRDIRDLSRRAVAALGLDFGAVDVGAKEDGSFIVLEVNSCPQIEGNTLEMYAEGVKVLCGCRRTTLSFIESDDDYDDDDLDDIDEESDDEY